MRYLAVALALLLGFSASAHAADLEPMPTKAPPMEAPPPPFEAGVGLALLLIPIALCVEFCRSPSGAPSPPPVSP
jgi:hypothetical protein